MTKVTLLSAVSIPNGMEFYNSTRSRFGESTPFQFPTGWNSTRYLNFIFLRSPPFQFPTGWNSTKYSFLTWDDKVSFQFPTGWNSTILFLDLRRQSIVSIPNGMEFYMLRMDAKLIDDRFNSQRDGILLVLTVMATKKSKVSIPNGMEFYMHYFKIWKCSQNQFQFPTGWNSTSPDSDLISYCKEFQFPTGWNSTLAHQPNRPIKIVSIPNGMEFYFV